jgi:hypothetical protein
LEDKEKARLVIQMYVYYAHYCAPLTLTTKVNSNAQPPPSPKTAVISRKKKI